MLAQKGLLKDKRVMAFVASIKVNEIDFGINGIVIFTPPPSPRPPLTLNQRKVESEGINKGLEQIVAFNETQVLEESKDYIMRELLMLKVKEVQMVTIESAMESLSVEEKKCAELAVPGGSVYSLSSI